MSFDMHARLGSRIAPASLFETIAGIGYFGIGHFGIDNAAIQALVEDAELISEIQRLREASGCAAP